MFIVSLPAPRDPLQRSFLWDLHGHRVDDRSLAARFDTVEAAHACIKDTREDLTVGKYTAAEYDDLRARLECARVERADLLAVDNCGATLDTLALSAEPNAKYPGTRPGDHLVGFAYVELRGDIGSGMSDCGITVAIEHTPMYMGKPDCYLLWLVEQFDDDGEESWGDGEWFAIGKVPDEDLLRVISAAITDRIDPAKVAEERRDDASEEEAAHQAGMAFGCDGYNDARHW